MACESHSCHAQGAEERGIPPLGRKLKIVGSIFLVLLALSFIPQLDALNDSLLSYLQIVWWAVLLGLVLGGVIDYFVPDGFIMRFLGQRRGPPKRQQQKTSKSTKKP